MWVYQEGKQSEISSVADSRKAVPEGMPDVSERSSSVENQKPIFSVEATVAPSPTQERLVSTATPVLTSADTSRKRKKPFVPSRNCILLATAYLLGTFAAGLLQVWCNASEADVLTYYVQCWQQLFAVQSIGQVVRLFWVELATLLCALTVFLLLGLSAIGPFPIYLFAMLYGTGTGLLSTQLFSLAEPLQIFVMAVLSGVPMAVSAGILCLFGSAALEVSNRLHRFSFGRGEQGGSLSSGATLLLGQFALAGISSLPLCGIAVCFAYLGSQIL